jgi:hypothetical protein
LQSKIGEFILSEMNFTRKHMPKKKAINHSAIVKRILVLIIVKIIIVLACLYAALLIFINTKGKDLLLAKLSAKYGRPVYMDSLTFKPPFNFEVINFKCGDFSFKKATASLNLSDPFQFPLNFDNVFIDGLYLKLIKEGPAWQMPPFFEDDHSKPQVTGGEIDAAPASQVFSAKSPVHFSLKKFTCRDSTIDIVFKNKKKPSLPLVFHNVELDIHDLSFPRFPIFSFDLKGSLKAPDPQQYSDSRVFLKGWLDYGNKNIDAFLKVEDFDYLAFQVFYHQVWKPRNLGLSEAILALDTKFYSLDNDLTIDLLFTLEKVKFLPAKEGTSGSRTKIIQNTVEHFRRGNQKPQYRFKARTTMDSPEQFIPDLLKDLRSALPIGPAIIAEAVIEKTQETISQGADQLLGKTKDAIGKGAQGIKKISIDATLNTIDTTIGAIKEIINPEKKADLDSPEQKD